MARATLWQKENSYCPLCALFDPFFFDLRCLGFLLCLHLLKMHSDILQTWANSAFRLAFRANTARDKSKWCSVDCPCTGRSSIWPRFWKLKFTWQVRNQTDSLQDHAYQRRLHHVSRHFSTSPVQDVINSPPPPMPKIKATWDGDNLRNAGRKILRQYSPDTLPDYDDFESAEEITWNCGWDPTNTITFFLFRGKVTNDPSKDDGKRYVCLGDKFLETYMRRQDVYDWYCLDPKSTYLKVFTNFDKGIPDVFAIWYVLSIIWHILVKCSF